MKRTKKNHLPFNGKILLCIYVILISTFFVSLQKLNIRWSYKHWWKYLSDGELYIGPTLSSGKIFIGNSYGTIEAVNRSSGKKIWSKNIDYALSSKIITYNKSIIFSTEQGRLYSLEAVSGDTIWIYSSPSLVQFNSDPKIHNNKLFITDASGTLYVLNPKSGELLWQFRAKIPSSADKFPTTKSSIDWRMLFSFRKNTIFLTGLDPSIYAINIHTGKIIWSFDTGSSITTYPEPLGDRVYVGNKNGDSYALSASTGKIAWQVKEKTKITCLAPVNPLNELRYFSDNPILNLLFLFLKNSIPWRTMTIIGLSDGTLRILDTSQKTLWQTRIAENPQECPDKWFTSLFVVNGNIIQSLNIYTGKNNWNIIGSGKFTYVSLLTWRSLVFRLHPFDLRFNVPFLLASNTQGKLDAIQGNTGKQLWSSNCYGIQYGIAKIAKDSLFYACSDGGLYHVALYSGGKAAFPNTINVSIKKIRVANTDIVEFTIHHSDAAYTNPFTEVLLTTDFYQSGKNIIKVNGFYYDRNTWKIRFNPPEKGVWHWDLQFNTPGNAITKSGSFISSTNTHNTFFRINPRAPNKITLDNTTVFNGIGIGNSIKDINHNDFPLDDWSIGVEPETSSSSSQPVRMPLSLDIFAKTYGPNQGGFNIFRWSINNSSFNLWSKFTYNPRFLTQEGKYGDSLVTGLMNNGYHLWITFFGFEIPFSNTQYPGELAALSSYLKYVVARYGAYASMWEIANEAYASDNLVTSLANIIKAADFEKRPIAMSWDHPSLKSIDVITPHTYETESIHNSDLWLLNKIHSFKNYNKPILFGEIGNTVSNWDRDSALRMRIKSWVAFFNEALLVYWNTSNTKRYHNSVIHNANQYIGDEERNYIYNLQQFTYNIALDAKPFYLPTSGADTRSYGLESSKEILGYFFHFASPYQHTSITTHLYIPHSGKLIWYMPSSGIKLNHLNLLPGYQTLHSPNFTADIAFKITFDKR